MNINIFISITIISMISLIGIFTLKFSEEKINKILIYLVAISVGGLLGGAFIHIIPESIEKISNPNLIGILLLSGFSFFFIIEKILHWRHCHIVNCQHHNNPIALTNIIGDAIHNFLDGAIIAIAYNINFATGIMVTFSVILHEIPQELGDYGILRYYGYSYRKALSMNFVTSLTAFCGAFLVIYIPNLIIAKYITYFLPFTAGGFIYIAASDLVPELKKNNKAKDSILQFLMILIGTALIFLVKEH